MKVTKRTQATTRGIVLPGNKRLSSVDRTIFTNWSWLLVSTGCSYSSLSLELCKSLSVSSKVESLSLVSKPEVSLTVVDHKESDVVPELC